MHIKGAVCRSGYSGKNDLQNRPPVQQRDAS